MSWMRRVWPWAWPLVRAHARVTRGLTLGVRGLVQDEEGRVLLIEHTYIPGWYMPGGGVEPGETAEAAVTRELLEEAGVELTERPVLLSVHDNGKGHPRDHVLVYRARGYRVVTPTQTGEILDRGWFLPHDLPAETTRATRARLREALEGEEANLLW